MMEISKPYYLDLSFIIRCFFDFGYFLGVYPYRYATQENKTNVVPQTSTFRKVKQEILKISRDFEIAQKF